jgi:hypothetical protein
MDWQVAADALAGLLISVLSFFGAIAWKDLQTLKASGITREEFNKAMGESAATRDANFRRLEDIFIGGLKKRHEDDMAVERRLGDIMTKIAELRPQRPGGEPERRHGY